MDALLLNPAHFGTFPWGVLSLGSYLKNEQGLDVVLLNAGTMPRKDFFAKLDEHLAHARLAGMTCFSTDVAFVKSVMDHIKSVAPQVKTVVGGPHAVLLPEQTAAYGNIDFVCYGLGEEPLTALIREAQSDAPDWSRVPGIIYKEDGRLVRTEPPTDIPFYDVDYTLEPANTPKRMGEYIAVLAGRGCSFNCTFCYNSVCGHKWVGRPAEDMVAELRAIVDRYDPKVVYFRDENFFHSKERTLRFIELYRKEGFRFEWRAGSRASYFTKSYINSELLADLASVNCQTIKFGFESGNQRTLNRLKKGVKVKKLYEVVDMLADSPIAGNYSFMIGIPGETPEEYRDTLKLIRYITERDPNAHVIGPQYYRIYPGGELYDEIVRDWGVRLPGSFEEWAQTVSNDLLGFNKNVIHPWLGKGRDLALHADMLTLLYRKPFRDYLSWKKFPAVLPAMLAKLRVKTGFYGMLWDIKLAYWLFQYYALRVMQQESTSQD